MMSKQPSPLVPQGSFEAQARGKSHVRIAVFSILAIHVVVLGGLLILGCKREDKTADAFPPLTNDVVEPAPFPGTDAVATPPTNTEPNPFAAPSTPTNPPGNTGLAGTPPTNPVPTPLPTPTAPPPLIETPPTSPTPIPDAGAPMTEHTIVRGESFSSLAARYGVSVKAIAAANPNLNPTRLKIGDKVKIPPKAAPSGNGNAGTASNAGAPSTYTVKSGDTLGKIAKANGTSVRELQRLNNLVTTQIKVGQKLKLPTRATPAPAAPAPEAPAPTPTPTPPGGFAPVPGVPAPVQ
jgi:LysM repeat protein